MLDICKRLLDLAGMKNKPGSECPRFTSEDVQDMIAAGCQMPGCTHAPGTHAEMAFTSRCHPGAGTYPVVRPGEDWLTIRCVACDQPVAEFALAHRTLSWAE